MADFFAPGGHRQLHDAKLPAPNENISACRVTIQVRIGVPTGTQNCPITNSFGIFKKSPTKKGDFKMRTKFA